MTPELVLHQYDFSCYSEKVRLVLGHKRLAWRSVEIPPTLPKPDYLPLTGGYRRAPALQIGADVYCDSVRIVEELERRFSDPSLYPGPDPVARRACIAGLECWTDAGLTRNAINYASCRYADAPRFTPEFLADRAALLGKPEPGLAHRRAAAAKNLAELRPQLAWIADLLHDGRPYVCGARMSLADCVLYHPLWVMDQLAGRRVPVIPDTVRGWMDRVAATGHGSPTPLSASAALDVAAAADPAPPLAGETLDGDPRPGETVTVTPVDYGKANPSAGVLVAIDTHRLTVRHTSDRLGPIHVHFPRRGYRVRSADP